MRAQKNYKLISTDYVHISHPDKDNDVYLNFKDMETGEEYKVYIDIDGFVDSFKLRYINEVVENYINHLRYYKDN